jgi:cyanophycinase
MQIPGFLVLEGGAEFGGGMEYPDRRAIELAGGAVAPVRILPTAAAPDNNHRRAGQNGVRWFQRLGCRDVRSLPLVDRASANDPEIAAELRQARLIYLLGGFPAHLGRSLAGSRAWQAALEAWQAGAVIAGSSAGAMVLCEHYNDPYESALLPGLNLLPGTLLLPHYNRFGASWQEAMRAALPDTLLLGIDEQTGAIGRPGGEWAVYGPGAVTLLRGDEKRVIPSGRTFTLPV